MYINKVFLITSLALVFSVFTSSSQAKVSVKDTAKPNRVVVWLADLGSPSAKNAEISFYYNHHNYLQAWKLTQSLLPSNDKQLLFVAGMENYYLHDYNKAFSFLSDSAAEGDIQAEDNLGSLYIRGLGIQQNNDQAVYWWRLAASTGADVQAAVNLSKFYFKHNDTTNGTRWYKYALLHGDTETLAMIESLHVPVKK